MKHRIFIKIFLCIFAMAGTLYLHLVRSNELTKLKVLIPKIEEELFTAAEENYRLSFEIEKFENPAHLIELSKQHEFSYLRHPYDEEILVVSIDKSMLGEKGDKSLFEKFSFEPESLPKALPQPIMVGARGK